MITGMAKEMYFIQTFVVLSVFRITAVFMSFTVNKVTKECLTLALHIIFSSATLHSSLRVTFVLITAVFTLIVFILLAYLTIFNLLFVPFNFGTNLLIPLTIIASI